MHNSSVNDVKILVDSLPSKPEWKDISIDDLKSLFGDISKEWIRSWNAGICIETFRFLHLAD